jgi:hypothetical protein
MTSKNYIPDKLCDTTDLTVKVEILFPSQPNPTCCLFKSDKN